MKERLYFIDVAKGLIILFLPIHHYASVLSRFDVSTGYDSMVIDWQMPVVCFFMPFFFVTSGICSDFNKEVKPFISSIFRSIIIPAVAITTIASLLWLIMIGDVNLLLDAFRRTPYTNLWFLPALAFSRCIYYGYNYVTSNPQPIGFSGILLAKRQNSFYCTYFLHNRNVADTKSPYPIKRLEVIRWFNQKSMVFNQSLS